MSERVKQLQEIEDRAARALLGAQALPPGPEREELLNEIQNFIARLSEMKATKH